MRYGAVATMEATRLAAKRVIDKETIAEVIIKISPNTNCDATKSSRNADIEKGNLSIKRVNIKPSAL